MPDDRRRRRRGGFLSFITTMPDSPTHMMHDASTVGTGLDRRARNRPVRTEHAAIARPRSQRRCATGADIEKLARISRHELRLLHGAMRAGDHGLKNHGALQHVANIRASCRIRKHSWI